MSGSAGNQRIIPLEEGWNDEIKAKVRTMLVDDLSHPFRTLCRCIVDFRFLLAIARSLVDSCAACCCLDLLIYILIHLVLIPFLFVFRIFFILGRPSISSRTC